MTRSGIIEASLRGKATAGAYYDARFSGGVRSIGPIATVEDMSTQDAYNNRRRDAWRVATFVPIHIARR